MAVIGKKSFLLFLYKKKFETLKGFKWVLKKKTILIKMEKKFYQKPQQLI